MGGMKNKSLIKISELFNLQSDHNYCRILPWKVECQGRLAFPSQQGFFRMDGTKECVS